MNEMTAGEAVKRLEGLENKFNPTKEIYVSDKEWSAIMVAASLLRRIAAGEYKWAVHAHITGHGYDLHCSNCGASVDIGDDYCKSCGALMGGKDDSNE